MGSGLLETDLIEEDLSDLTVLTYQIISSCCDNNVYQQERVVQPINHNLLEGLKWIRI